MAPISLIWFYLFCQCFSAPVDAPGRTENLIDGLSFVAPPRPFPSDPMPEVKATGAGWIAVIPYAYTRPGEPVVHHGDHPHRWWGESPEGALTTIRLAKKAGLKIMLKPQVWIPGSWPGDLDFAGESDWAAWEEDYYNFIWPYLEMAARESVEMFCIGTEFRHGVSRRTNFWQELIRSARKVFPGKLVYAANWDDYREVPFWDELDFIGVNAYFPLTDRTNPKTNELSRAWVPWTAQLTDFHRQVGKPILFTEFGYLSVDRCAWNTWELEREIENCRINQAAQANALQALFTEFSDKAWWAGGFLWKWFPNMQGHEGYPARDYTPQGKSAERVLSDFYHQH